MPSLEQQSLQFAIPVLRPGDGPYRMPGEDDGEHVLPYRDAEEARARDEHPGHARTHEGGVREIDVAVSAPAAQQSQNDSARAGDRGSQHPEGEYRSQRAQVAHIGPSRVRGEHRGRGGRCRIAAHGPYPTPSSARRHRPTRQTQFKI